jgi:hypothetical protein
MVMDERVKKTIEEEVIQEVRMLLVDMANNPFEYFSVEPDCDKIDLATFIRNTVSNMYPTND